MFSAWIALALAVVGVALPLLPTTPFVLLAAFFFSKSSERCHTRLRNSKTFGPLIVDWENYKVIRPRAKKLAGLMLSSVMLFSFIFVSLHTVAKLTLLLIWFSVLSFIWSCPGERGEDFQLVWSKLWKGNPKVDEPES